MLGHRVRSLLGLKVIITLQLFSYVQAAATHRETLHHKTTLLQPVMSNSLPKDWKRWGDASPELHPCRIAPRWRVAMVRRGKVCMVTALHAAGSTEGLHEPIATTSFQGILFYQKVVNHKDWSQKSWFSTLVNGPHPSHHTTSPSHHTTSFRGILVIPVKWRHKADDKVLFQLPSYSSAWNNQILQYYLSLCW